MPEGPEVATIVSELNELIINKRISDVNISTEKEKSPLGELPLSDFKKQVIKKKITAIERKGKMIIITLDKETHLLFHLLMTGQLWVQTEKPRFHRITFSFETGEYLHLADKSTWVIIKLFDDVGLGEFIPSKKLGIDVLSKKFTLISFKDMLNTTRKIHSLLLDQKVISGLGNIYVNEALFLARIKPDRPAKSLTKKEISSLYKSIKKTIADATKHNGTTFSDYRTPKGNKGNHQDYLKVFKRANKECTNCGNPLQKSKVSGRSTFYCEKCQK